VRSVFLWPLAASAGAVPPPVLWKAPLALGFLGNFGKKKGDAGDGHASSGPSGHDSKSGAAGEGEKFTVNPGTAKNFFDRAAAIQETENYEYATTLWLQGLRWDPTSMKGHEGFYACASAFGGPAPGKAPSKDQLGAIGGKSPVERYLQALLSWGTRSMDWQLGMKAFEAASKLGLNEPGYWLGSRVLGAAVNDRKVKKEHLVQMMGWFSAISAYDRAVQAGEAAVRLDPADGALVAQVRNMSAQATMNKGGYEASGQAGGFRQNVKDISGQRAREEEERIVKTEDVLIRSIENARKDYEQRPTDPSAIDKLARLLLERGTEADEKDAYGVLMKGFQQTNTYKFKQRAGDIKMRVGRRVLREKKAQLDAEPSNAERVAAYESANRKVLDSEIAEYAERVAAYPTDLVLKFELGRRYAEVGDHEKAIEQFQVAQNAPGQANTVLAHLAASFVAMGWLDEAEGTYRRALERHEATGDDLALALRYGLMDVLQRRAAESRDLGTAEEAFKFASAIAIQQIGYRDIKTRREQLQALVKELRTAKS